MVVVVLVVVYVRPCVCLRFSIEKNEIFVFYRAFIHGDVYSFLAFLCCCTFLPVQRIHFNVSIRFDDVVSGFACNEW